MTFSLPLPSLVLKLSNISILMTSNLSGILSGALICRHSSYCFSCCLRMTDKRQLATKVKCKRDKSITKEAIMVEYILLLKKHLSFTGALRGWTQNFTKIDQKKHKIKPIFRRLSWRNEVVRNKEKQLFSQASRQRTNFRPLKVHAFKCSVHTTLTVNRTELWT